MESDSALKRQRLRTESYERKLEHRAAIHECLRDRNNVTTCRSPGTPQESEWKSSMRKKRQREFQKRRQISNEATSLVANATSPAIGKDKGPKEKVTLRGNRRKVPLIHRQSLVTSDDLGITWPDVSALAQASWMSQANMDQEDELGVTVGSIPDTTTGVADGGDSWRRRGRSRDRVQNNQRNRHVSVSDFSSQTECGYVTIKEEELIQLGEYLKEALWREDTLKQKLVLLQKETSTLLTYCDTLWRAYFKEDLLKCKIGALESQLQVCSQRFSRDEGKRLLMLMEEQFRLEEERAVASLQRASQDRARALEKVACLERALERAQEESSHWQQLHEEQVPSCNQLRLSLQQTSDQMLSLQSQMEKSALHEVRLQEQLQQLQDQYDLLCDASSPLEQDQPCAQQRTDHNSAAPVSEQHCTDQVHHHTVKQISTVRAELPTTTDHNSQPGVQTVQSDTARKKRGMRRHILRAGCCLLLLLLFLVAMALLWFHHPMNKEELDQLYLIMEDFAERCLQEMTSPDYPKCFKPI
ncbi:TRAF3-interacting JNK-activating modulator-like [Engraulis encrasicolus]|uniref:TRAF3-interacting JNK-activating modulator-like n=1 Tax=Engraulis encrasicolus TaxID=184585 RepID=UPI002FD52AF6